jgi:hypothetical protein
LRARQFLIKYGEDLIDWGLSAYGSLDYETPNKSDLFVNYAENDLSYETESGDVNALSNAKRAIDCQVEQLIKLLGLKKEKSFPKKLGVMKAIGLIVPRILEKVNKTRNMLEHEFVHPERSQVEDAVDVATLFVKLTNGILYNFYHDFEVHESCDEFKKKGEHTYFELGKTATGLKIWFEEKPDPHFNVIGYVKDQTVMNYNVTKDFPEYLPILKAFVILSTTNEDPIDIYKTMKSEICA